MASLDPASDSGSSHWTSSQGPAPRSLTPAAIRQPFPKQLSDKFRLGEELGRGAYGQVFRGLDARTGEHVAIKQISLDRIPAGALAGIMTEVELLKALNHRNVVKYLGSLRTRTHLYIVMELVEGGSLASVIKANRFGPFPESLVAIYIQQVLQGLAYLHEQGVVHRDIKGANILTTRDGVVKLADFGVAAKMGEGGTVVGNTAESQPAGTPYWMAPEVVELKTITTASDVWSLGCLAVELVMGHPPYHELQPLSALYNIVQDPHPPLPPGISVSMRDFLLECFRKEPSLRPSAKTLINHPWISLNRQRLRSTWDKTLKNTVKSKPGGNVPHEAHATVASVVERILAADRSSTSTDDGESPKHASVDGGGNGYGVFDSGSEASTAVGPTHGENTATEEAFLRRIDSDATGANLLAQLDRLYVSKECKDGATRFPKHARPPPAQSTDNVAALQEEAEVIRQASLLRLMATPGERSLVEEAAAAASARTLLGYLSGSAALRTVFINANGLCGLRELLDSSSERLLGPTLDLLLALTAEDATAMELVCALGLVPAALRLAGPQHPAELRLRAARFANSLARSSEGGAHMLVACQGVPFFLSMMDETAQSPEQLELLRTASAGFWTILYRSQTPNWPLSTNAYLRLMAHHGLPQRLVRVLPWVLKHASAELSVASHQARKAKDNAHFQSFHALRASTGSQSSSSSITSGLAMRPSNRVVPEESVMLQGIDGQSVTAETSIEKVPISSDSQLLDSLVGIFAALTFGDSVVKARCCQLEAINTMFGLTVRMPLHLQVRVLQAVRRLTSDQGVAGALQAANVIQYLVSQLPRTDAAALQAEALVALHNLCQLNKSRQEAVAASGAVAWLCRLAVAPPNVNESESVTTASAANAAVAVLCSLAHCSPRTRAELWAAGSLDIFLQLLKEESHAASVLEALASWLDAEAPRIESRLLEETALARLVLVLRNDDDSSLNDSERLPSVLSPLTRMLSRSSKLAVALAPAGLATRTVGLLRRPTPTSALALMDVLQLMYESHPHPKEFLAVYRVTQTLMALAKGAAAGDQILVRTRVENLLQAFSVNSVF